MGVLMWSYSRHIQLRGDGREDLKHTGGIIIQFPPQVLEWQG